MHEKRNERFSEIYCTSVYLVRKDIEKKKPKESGSQSKVQHQWTANIQLMTHLSIQLCVRCACAFETKLKLKNHLIFKLNGQKLSPTFLNSFPYSFISFFGVLRKSFYTLFWKIRLALMIPINHITERVHEEERKKRIKHIHFHSLGHNLIMLRDFFSWFIRNRSL